MAEYSERVVTVSEAVHSDELDITDRTRGIWRVWISGYDSGIYYVGFWALGSARWFVSRELRKIAENFTIGDEIVLRTWHDRPEGYMLQVRGANDFGWTIDRAPELEAP
jgi:hypothetical protein